jgi:branched-subunit amino acid ABC-type transport system permease component
VTIRKVISAMKAESMNTSPWAKLIMPMMPNTIVLLIVAMALTALWGWSIERIAYRPLRGSFRLAPLIRSGR